MRTLIHLQRGEVSDEVVSFLKDSVLKLATNAQKQWIDKRPIPKIQELRPRRIDMPMRLLVSKKISSHNQWLKKMQTTYEAAGPLIHLSNLEVKEEMDTDQVKETLKISLSLLGNCFARFYQERRRKVLVGINSQLGHMAKEVFESPDVLFSDGAVDRIQRLLRPFRRLNSLFSRVVYREKASLYIKENTANFATVLAKISPSPTTTSQ